eukprot:CAMPEP_0178989034 /NCGR_PEP_ID=MMETSP0795-20121207/4133_1 /TAXON_ID=88552 /ORGANISM="Amoebophrya sp., Strain Ameob2" /LENGTH=60 /DNA_ID=CAMNT_0020680357 /DNA_START=149 /DNA_END=331 /DNA_ORIENTATION=+
MKKVFGLLALLVIVNLGFIACEPNSTSDAGDDNVFESVEGTNGDEDAEEVEERGGSQQGN